MSGVVVLQLRGEVGQGRVEQCLLLGQLSHVRDVAKRPTGNKQ